jgi:hypothetical protein
LYSPKAGTTSHRLMRTIRATAEIPLVNILSENQQTNLFNGLFFNGLDSILK